MSYRTGNNQEILENILYNNSVVDNNETELNNLASIEYVKNEISTFDFTTILSTINFLQSEINYLQNKYNVLLEKNNRVIGSIYPSSLLVAPTNYKICNGDLIPVSDYPQLFDIIGYQYGGQGFNFALPNIQNYFILGSNNTIDNLPYSNIMSGNNYDGATNNYLKYGSVSTFPIIQNLPEHTHTYTGVRHDHEMGYDFQPYSTVGTEYYVKVANQDGNFNSEIAYTNIQINNNGSNIQQTDPLSNISGVNTTPPFFSVNFLICVS